MIFSNEPEPEQVRTREMLAAGARDVAGALQARGIGHGARVAVMMPNSLRQLEVFFGVWMTGATLVPFYPPRGGQDVGYQAALAAMLSRVQPKALIAADSLAETIEAALPAGAPIPVYKADALTVEQSPFCPTEVHEDTVAVILFTSGSTSAPKGVMLSHRAFLTGVRAMGQGLGCAADEVSVVWLPLQHCAGLLFACLGLFLEGPLVLMSTMAVAMEPRRWISAIHRYRGTLSIAFNSSFQRLVNQVSPEDLVGLDLSCWRHPAMGGEQALASTMAAFDEKFASVGLPRGAIRGGYGMTEVALGATCPPFGPPVKVDRVDADALEQTGRAVPVRADAPGRQANYVSVGPPLPGVRLRIVDGERRLLPERHVGEIEIQSPMQMEGYAGDPEATAVTLDDGWLRTGDVGYMSDGELYVVGRSKEMIISNGRKLIPVELERLAGAVDGASEGALAAISIPDLQGGTESLVMACETPLPPAECGHILAGIRRALTEGARVTVDAVAFLPPGTLPRTSSGKLYRNGIREQWLAGAYAGRIAGRNVGQR